MDFGAVGIPEKETNNMSALKILKEMAITESRFKYPNVPEYARPQPKYSDKDANGLTACVVDFINFSGGWATRVNSQGQWVEAMKKWIPSNTEKGTPDVIACIDSHFYGIEIKMKDKQSDDQKKVEAKIAAAKGHYMIVRSFEEFYTKLKAACT